MNSQLVGFLSTLLAMVVSIAATWFFAWLYYRRAGDELRQEAKELIRLTSIVLDGLQSAGLISVNRDQNGRPIGINVTIQPGAAEVCASGHAPAVITSEPSGK